MDELNTLSYWLRWHREQNHEVVRIIASPSFMFELLKQVAPHMSPYVDTGKFCGFDFVVDKTLMGVPFRIEWKETHGKADQRRMD